MKRLLVLGLFIAFSSVHGADEPTQTTLYKYVGPDGRIVYGDRPPGGGRAAKTMRFENLPSSPLSPATLAYLEQLKKGGAVVAAQPPPGDVLLFTASWCGYCKKAKAYLSRKGAAFREIDIESNGGAASYAQAGGQRGVPLLVNGGQRVTGFSESAYDSLFGAKN